MQKSREFDEFVIWCIGEFLEQRWGDDLCEEDRHQNEMVYSDPEKYGRILASYKSKTGNDKTLWIIREADCSVTTILFPDEY